MYPVHKNATGSFQELIHASEVAFGQLSILTIAPRGRRGGHYHTRKHEWFCCVRGRCYLATIATDGSQQRSYDLSGLHREFVHVYPHHVHTLLNAFTRECEILIISSEEFDLDNPDTIVSKANEEVACPR